MWGKSNIAVNKRPNYDKLAKYGFSKQGEQYVFSVNIMDGDFRLIIYASYKETTFKIIDNSTEEEYRLVYISDAVGSFIGTVRSASEEVINDVIDKCYDAHIFKSPYTKQVIEYVENKYGAKAEYLWEKTPNNAIFRDPKSKKWYLALLTIAKRKIGIDEDGYIEIIDLKETPENIERLVDGINYLAGYHMNKKHWYTMKLDGSVPIKEIYKRIDKSFELLFK
ncbi:MAG: MmcQ/YjbR family DNA-binding protein [Alphaproteobacteria bacterium]|nr:MmcQ/YjbR family DNA-binding protein [Alphaproteobacteria bacterium]